MRNDSPPELNNGLVKSLRTLATLHGTFFLAGGLYLQIFAQKMGVVPPEFIFMGILSYAAALRLKTHFSSGAILALLSAISYWVFSVIAGIPMGFIKGISVTVSLMGFLSVWLLLKK